MTNNTQNVGGAKLFTNPKAHPDKGALKFDTPKKGKLRIMPVSDSPWAPTGFGTNTKNVAAILTKEGHHIGYAGCQNPTHDRYEAAWPLGQTEKKEVWENLPIMFPGQERFGEKSFPHWVKNFKPQVIWTHLDFQMFAHVAQAKAPKMAQLPLYDPKTGMLWSRKERAKMLSDIFKQVQKGVPWKWAATIPFDGQPCIPSWQEPLDQIDYKICMSRYGQLSMEEEFKNCERSWYIPHGVDCNTFKPIMAPNYGKEVCPSAFIVGCVARNQHRKNIPQLIKGFKEFIDRNDLKPDEVKLILHMDWNDAMGWKFPEFAERYGVEDYLMPPLMGILDAGESLSEEEMIHLYNCMDVFVLPTAGEGFGIPTIEAMACGVPVAVTNYTTAWEIIKEDDPETADIPLYPLGGKPGDSEGMNGRDHLKEEDICEAGILLPYKDMWWDTPKRAAPQRAICSSVAIADALDYYYHNPKKRLAAGKAARKKALKEYDWEPVGKRWIEMAKVWEAECA
jgi:glycosyltransferase involved in cell wall biosynthesis